MYRFALASLPLLLVLQADLLEQLATRLMAVQMWPRLRAAVLLVSTVLLWATVHSLRPAIGSQYDLYSYHKEVEVPTWIEVGKWFRDNAPPDATIALVPIGAVGFFSELVVYDMLGLTDHHIAHRSLPHVGSGWAGHEKHDGPYILSRRPTYLLLGNVDVTAAARDPGAAPFIPHATPAIRAREKDLYEVGLDDYVPRSVQLPSGSYLNFYELREASRAAQVVARGEAVPAGAPRAR